MQPLRVNAIDHCFVVSHRPHPSAQLLYMKDACSVKWYNGKGCKEITRHNGEILDLEALNYYAHTVASQDASSALIY
jgi:hypothetical protein